MPLRVLLLAVALLAAPPLLAWGEKGHLMVNEAAAAATPNDLPPFFHRARSRLTYLGVDPDRWYTGGFPSIRAVNFPEHFLDYEYVAGLQLPADRYAYVDLLYSSGTLRRFGIGNATAGFAPWRIAELAELLTVQWRLWRDAPPGPERDQIEENIIFIAGTLGHYVGDTANPHHVTIHYNGWASAENPERFRTDCETHERFEFDFVTRAIELADVEGEMREPVLRAQYFSAAMAHVRESHALLEELYRMDRDGDFDRGMGTSRGRSFAARRLAAGASLLRDLWWTSWRESARPLKDWRTR
jgi:hypothetical protein